MSLVTIGFDDNTDICRAREQISEQLLKLQAIFPPGVGTTELGAISTCDTILKKHFLNTSLNILRQVYDWLYCASGDLFKKKMWLIYCF